MAFQLSERASGVLLHPTSLPGVHGCGDAGPEAHAFARWLHGAGQLRGWGYASVPDRVLLHVRGFDPTTRRYRYAVNGRFGAAMTTGNGLIVPFQVGFQGRVTIGPHRTRIPRENRPS